MAQVPDLRGQVPSPGQIRKTRSSLGQAHTNTYNFRSNILTNGHSRDPALERRYLEYVPKKSPARVAEPARKSYSGLWLYLLLFIVTLGVYAPVRN